MEKEFTDWFAANEKRFAHGQLNDKQIAYSAWLQGQRKQPHVVPTVCVGCITAEHRNEWIEPCHSCSNGSNKQTEE